MKVTETLSQDIAEFEQSTGNIVRPELLPILMALAADCDFFQELGAKDAVTGRSQRGKSSFIKWGKRKMKDPQEKIMPFIELIYMSYIEGYTAAKLHPLN